MKRLLTWACFALMAMACQSAIAANTTISNTTDDTGTAGTLRSLIAAASDGDTVSFPASAVTILLTQSNRIQVENSITILGADTSLSIIDANFESRIFRVAEGKVVRIKNITMVNGRAPNGSDGPNGSYSDGDDLADRNAGDGEDGKHGGAIQVLGTLYLESCQIYNCSAGNGGEGGVGAGGYDNDWITSVLAKSDVFGSTYPNAGSGGDGGNGGSGGAIYCNNGTLIATNCRFIGNTSGSGGVGRGGGDGGDGDTNTFFGGLSQASKSGKGGNSGDGGAGGNGGAILFNTDGTDSLIIVNCIFVANRTKNGGRSFRSGDGGNGANGSSSTGGNSDGSDSGNAGDGGRGGNGSAVRFIDSTGSSVIHFTNCVFSENRLGLGESSVGVGAPGNGPGSASNGSNGASGTDGVDGILLFITSSTLDINIDNSIIWGNLQAGGSSVLLDHFDTSPTIANFDVSNSITQNDDTELTGATNVSSVDPEFLETGLFTISYCSPAVDAGSDAAFGLSYLGNDILGNPRLQGTIDMGVMETQPPTITEVANGQVNIEIEWDFPDAISIDNFNLYRNGSFLSSPASGDDFALDNSPIPGAFETYCLEAEIDGCASTQNCALGRAEADGKITGRVSTNPPADEGIPGVQVCAFPTDSGNHAMSTTAAVIETNPPSENNNAGTIMAWIKPTSVDPSASDHSITGRHLVSRLGIRSSGVLRLRLGDGVNWQKTFDSKDTLVANQWQHIAATWENTDSLRIYMYLNGQLFDELATSSEALTTSGGGSRYIGGSLNSSSVVTNFFEGEIDELSIWNTTRSATQIWDDQRTIFKGDESGLTYFYRFENDTLDGELYAMDYLKGGQSHVVYPSGIALASGPDDLGYCGVTTASGNYEIRELVYDQGGSDYTLIPFELDRNYNPGSIVTASISDNSPLTGQNFKDTTSLSITGFAIFPGESLLGDCLLEGVKISVPNATPFPTEVFTDVNGEFSIIVPGPGTYTVTPSFNSDSFDPEDTTFTILNDVSNLVFTNTELVPLHMRVLGGCDNRIFDDVTFRVVSSGSNPAGCIDKTFTVGNGIDTTIMVPPQQYTVNIAASTPVNTALISSLGSRTVELGDTLTSNDTVEFIYHQVPDIEVIPFADTIVNILSGGCSGSVVDSFYVLSMGQIYPVTLRVTEDYNDIDWPIAANCPVSGDSAVVLVTDETTDSTIAPIPIDSNGFATYFTRPLLINPVAPFDWAFGFTAYLDGTTGDWNRKVVVEGFKQDNSSFVTVSPDLPFLILRDPPGDGSFSFFESTKEYCYEESVVASRDIANGGDFTIKRGAAFSTGTDVYSVDLAVWASVNASWDVGSNNIDAETTRTCVRTNAFDVTTSDEDFITGDPATVILASAYNIYYSTAEAVDFNPDSCKFVKTTTLVVQEDSLKTQFAYTKDFIENVEIPALENLRDSYPLDSAGELSIEALKTANQIDVWEQILVMEDSLEMLALEDTSFTTNWSFNGGGTTITSSVGVSKEKEFSYAFDLYLDKVVAVEAGYELVGSGEFGGYRHTKRVSTTTNTTNYSSLSSEIGYTLVDDDLNDFFSVQVGTDPIYQTPVFKLLGGETSCPIEPGTVARDNVIFTIPSGSSSSIFVPAGQTDTIFQLNISNISTSTIDPDRRYYFGVDDETSEGASFVVNGEPLTSDLVAITVDNGITRTIPIQISRGATLAYTFENIRFFLIPECDYFSYLGGSPFDELEEVFVSVFFDPPCPTANLANPMDNWFVNAIDNDELIVTVDGYSVVNLESVEFQYRLLPFGSWTPFHLVDSATLAGTLFGSYDYVWNVAGLPDGDYSIRAKNKCADGTFSYTNISSGSMQRTASQLLSTFPLDGDTLFAAADLSASYNELLFCGTVDFSNLSIFLDDGTQIDFEDPVCFGSTVSVAQNAAALDSMEDKWVTAQVFDLIDQFGNAIDTAAWRFFVNLQPDATCTQPPQNPVSGELGLNVILGWDPVPGAIGCQIMGGPIGDPTFTFIKIGPPSFVQFPTGTLIADTTYIWKVRCACNLDPLVATTFSVVDTFMTGSSARVENPQEVGLKLYPNPASSMLVVELEGWVQDEVEFTISDVHGIVHYSKLVDRDWEMALHEVDVSRFPTGTYFVSIKSGNFQRSQYFVKVE